MQVNQEKSKMRDSLSKLRLLDFDDLLILRNLLEEKTIAATAAQLGLTQPAITQRLRKIERIFDDPIIHKVGRQIRLTNEGRILCLRISEVISLIEGVKSSNNEIIVSVEPDMGLDIFWKALKHFKIQVPDVTCHCAIRSYDKIISDLESGNVNACFTMAQRVSLTKFETAEIAEESLVLVGSQDMDINSIKDLEHYTLLDIDKSCPMLQFINTPDRASMKFKDYWFLGSMKLIISALLKGSGIAVVPERLVQASIGIGKLKILLPNIDISPNIYQLIYLKDQDLSDVFKNLVKFLKLASLK